MDSNSRVFCVFLLFGISLFASALKLGEEGVCETTISEQAMKQKKFNKNTHKNCPAMATMCTPEQEKNMKDFNRYLHICCTKPYGPIRKEKVLTCCDGWIWRQANDTCIRICHRGCLRGGYCAANGGVCKCRPPLVFINETTCGLPTCNPSCFNAQCLNNNECSCHPKHKKYNATHCAPTCDSGQFFDVQSFTCKNPTCDAPCVNGQCVNNSECSCDPKHYKLNTTHCAPNCDPGLFLDVQSLTCKPLTPTCNPPCVNGHCVNNSECICNPKYNKLNATHCVPICDAGQFLYVQSWTCQPLTSICNPPCFNGQCVNNKCVCDPKHYKYNSTHCAPTCDSGQFLDVQSFTCKLLTCDPPCVNGQCVNNSECSCGPQRNKLNTTHCIPYCDPGLFLDIQSLTCKPLTPTCYPPCINGQCVNNDECSCYPKHDKYNATHCVPNCDPGLVLDEQSLTCVPRTRICYPPCINGQCFDSDECNCGYNYDKHNSTHCAPNCDPGLFLDDQICKLPTCEPPCINGQCVYNECNCNPKQRYPNATYCVPYCDVYLKNPTHASLCFKTCNGPCEFGKCSIFRECIMCDYGYDLLNGTCLALTAVDCASCEHECTNGECYCSDDRPCNLDVSIEGGFASAGPVQSGLTWILCGATMLVLMILAVVVMQSIWRRRKLIKEEAGNCQGNTQSNIMFTLSDTPMIKKISEDIDEKAKDSTDAGQSVKTAHEELVCSESSEQPQDLV